MDVTGRLGVPPDDLFFGKKVGPWIDVTTARKKGEAGPVLMLLVTTTVSTAPAHDAPPDPDDHLANHMRYATEKLRAVGVEPRASSVVKMHGIDSVQVECMRGDVPVSIRLFDDRERQVELRCIGGARGPSWPCEAAVSKLEIRELAGGPPGSDQFRVLHLHDDYSGIEFDAPDDSWLAVGPRPGLGGAQVVWIWRKEARQIDVQAMDLSISPIAPDTAWFANKLAETLRRDGEVVARKSARLAGEPCEHLEITLKTGDARDMFVLVHGGFMYALLVTAPTRDPHFVEQARLGFRLSTR